MVHTDRLKISCTSGTAFTDFYPPRLAELYFSSFRLSVTRSFVLSVNWITHDRGNGRRPNMVDMGKG